MGENTINQIRVEDECCSQSKKLTTAITQRTEGVKTQQAKLHPKTVICNLLITILLSHDYWTV